MKTTKHHVRIQTTLLINGKYADRVETWTIIEIKNGRKSVNHGGPFAHIAKVSRLLMRLPDTNLSLYPKRRK